MHIKNNTETVQVWCGQEIQAGSYYHVQAEEEMRWRNDAALLASIVVGDAIVNDGVEDLTDVNDAIIFLKDGAAKIVTVQSLPAAPAFVSNRWGDKSLFLRVHGVQVLLVAGSNTIDFTVPYDWAKISGADFFGTEHLDSASLLVLDSTTGTYTSVPNYQLNQFGFSANLRANYHSHASPYDANLYIGMRIRIVYESVSAKTLGINYMLHEVK